MNTKKVLLALLTFLMVILLSGCLQSDSQIMDEADNRLKEVFLSDEVIEPNFELNRFEIFKPESLKVSEEKKNNVIFYEEEQPYILFINEFEEPNSKWYYNELKKEEKMYLSMFESEDEFAYFSVDHYNEDELEVQLGIGGIKMATLTTMNDIEEDVEIMIRMVKSIEKK